jgi:hypothetical protein
MANNPRTNPGGDAESITPSSASSAQKTGHIRWVLAIGTLLVILGFVIAWIVIAPH